MGLFKRKQKFESKFHLNDFVLFHLDRNTTKVGLISKVKQQSDGSVVYDISVGGECTSYFENIEENKIVLNK